MAVKLVQHGARESAAAVILHHHPRPGSLICGITRRGREPALSPVEGVRVEAPGADAHCSPL